MFIKQIIWALKSQKEKTMKKILAIITTFILLTCNSAFSNNYINELSQYALWKNSKNITVWVQPCEYSATVYNAFREWMIASNNCVRFVDAKERTRANITVTFHPELNGLQAGVTNHYSAGKYMVKADIKLRYMRFGHNKKLTQDQMYAVAVHEIGHAIGILGHSSNRNDIMYPTTDIIGIHASNRDVNTIRQFYCTNKYK